MHDTTYHKECLCFACFTVGGNAAAFVVWGFKFTLYVENITYINPTENTVLS
jgi:hypothetical protein